MNPQQQRLIRESFPEIRPMSGPVSLLFYPRLFALDPSQRPMFRQDIEVHGRKLMDTAHGHHRQPGTDRCVGPDIAGHGPASRGLRSQAGTLRDITSSAVQPFDESTLGLNAA